jgi:formamidopyrimidine-DNA glycosylase
MPELPEVETSRRIIEESLLGASVIAADLRLAKMLRYSEMSETSILIGRTLQGVRRRAKILILDWSGGLATLFHLKLSGQVTVFNGGMRQTAGHPIPDPAGEFPHKATHFSLTFDGDRVLYLSDIRQFGWIRIMPTESVDAFLMALKFGPEAIGPGGITSEHLGANLARRSIPIKLALLDQGLIAGIGNIYADEALHRAHIHPLTPANRVPTEKIPQLLTAIQWALDMGIRQGGAKIVHNKAYPIDGFPEVHARKGEACPVCGDTVLKIRVGPRGTYFCPTCQPLPKGESRSTARSSARTPRSTRRTRRDP